MRIMTRFPKTVDFKGKVIYNILKTEVPMKHINSLFKKALCKNHSTGCGECQSSCQSACKTSCTVGNQSCKKEEKINVIVKKSV